jgi:branched-chain amino acid transport system permease protein
MSRTRSIQALFILGILGIAIYLPLWTDSYYDRLLVKCLIWAIIAISFNLYLGFLGGLTLAQTAFFGMGGYATGIMTVKMGWPTGAGFLVSISICAVAALVLGLTALRLKGPYFVIITVAFLGIISELSITLRNFTEGTSGLWNIPSTSPGFDFDTPQRFYYLALIFLILISILVYRLINSRVGRGFIAVRDNEDLANSLGINPFKYKMIGFVTSAVIAGAAGWLYAHYTQSMDPNSVFGFTIMFDVAFMVILGGTGTLVGPIVGAFVVIFIPELFVEHVYYVDPNWRTAFLAIFMLLMIIAMPMGVWGFIKMRWMQYQAKRAMVMAPEHSPSSLEKLTEPLRAFFTRGPRPKE